MRSSALGEGGCFDTGRDKPVPYDSMFPARPRLTYRLLDAGRDKPVPQDSMFLARPREKVLHAYNKNPPS